MTTKEGLKKLNKLLRDASALCFQLQGKPDELMEGSVEHLDNLSASVSDATLQMEHIYKAEGMKG